MVVILDEKLKKEIEIEVEKQMKVYREKMWKELELILYPNENNLTDDVKIEREDDGNKIECERCSHKFEDEDLDFISIDEGESVLVCRNCEEDIKEACR